MPDKTLIISIQEKTICDFLNTGLKSQGYKILTVSNGLEAINLISIYAKSDHPVDLLIIDTETWKNTEVNILSHIREYRFNLPVIVTYLVGDIFPKTSISGPFPSAIVSAINMEKVIKAIDKQLGNSSAKSDKLFQMVKDNLL